MLRKLPTAPARMTQGIELEMAAMRGETAEQHDRLALDHAAGQDDRVAVPLNELFDGQGTPLAPLSPNPGRGRAEQRRSMSF